MAKRIPISVVSDIIKHFHLKQAILVTWDGVSTSVVTDGNDVHQAEQAAEGGNMIKRALNWPEQHCNAVSAKVVALTKRIAELEKKLNGK